METSVRRKEKQIQDQADVEKVIRAATVCFLALCDGLEPYVIPLSFGYADGRLYFHSAGEGRKIELIRRHPLVGFALAVDVAVAAGDRACDWTMRYRSVVGRGRAVILDDAPEKIRGLDLIMAHYGGAGGDYDARRLAATRVIRLDIQAMTGKRSG
jgi:nitroimidazol reductase NimA-like FMN-containing flavoprotein (pyridoxamine 5'-phosphate oxidase superfamily)